MAASIPILSDIFGKKPDIIDFHPIDYGESQLKSILENLKAFPQIQALGSYFQKYMTDAYNKAIPNFSHLLEMGGKSAEDILKAAEPLIHGEIPEDVKGVLMRSGALQGLGKGEDFIRSLQGRDIARTSLDLMNVGQTMARAGASATQQWAGLASGLIMSPSGFLITPAQQANLDLQQKLIKREVEQARANVNAAPNPIAKGLSDLVAYLTASYIGRGPAGKPPEATSYQTGIDNAAVLNAGGSISSTQKSGLFGWGPSTTTTTGPLEDISYNTEFTPQSGGANVYGGGGAGSAWPPSDTVSPGIRVDDVNQALSATNWTGAQDWGYGPGVPPPNPINTDYYNFSNNAGMFPQNYNPSWPFNG
jgi:hypothetical protein